ncbi:MAG: hypothetical protein ACTSXW_05185 [Candidatus Baldrarchaeia archaeon]
MGLLSSLTKTLLFVITLIGLVLSTLEGITIFLKVTNLTLRGFYNYIFPISTFYISLMLFLKLLTRKESFVHAAFYISIIHMSSILLLSNLKIAFFIFAILTAPFLIIKNKKKPKKILNSIPEIVAIYNGNVIFKDNKGLLKAICAIKILNLEKFDEKRVISFLNVVKSLKINVSIEFHKHKNEAEIYVLAWCVGKNFEEVVKKAKKYVENLTNCLNLLQVENQILLDEISIEETVFAPIPNWTIKNPNNNVSKNYVAAKLQGFSLLKAILNNFTEDVHLSMILSPLENCGENLSLVPPHMFFLIGNKEILAMLCEKWDVTIYLVAFKESMQLITQLLGLKIDETNIGDVILRRQSENPLNCSLLDVLRLLPWIEEEELKVAVRDG